MVAMGFPACSCPLTVNTVPMSNSSSVTSWDGMILCNMIPHNLTRTTDSSVYGILALLKSMTDTHPINLTLIVPDVDIRMHQCLVHGDTALRVNHQHLLKQITRHRCLQTTVFCAIRWKQNVREQFFKRISGVLGSVLNVVAYRRLKSFHEVRRRRSKLLYDLIPLIYVWTWR